MGFKKLSKNIKAQMTIFIILGFIILITFMMLSAVANSIKEVKIKSEGTKALKSFITTSTINQYITSCLDSVTNDAIEKIAIQGGSIYDYQNNMKGDVVNTSNFEEGVDYIELNISKIPINNNPYVLNPMEYGKDIINVTYGLRISKNLGYFPYIDLSSPNPPIYPIDEFLNVINGYNNNLLTQLALINNMSPVFYPYLVDGLYGEFVYPGLCDSSINCANKAKDYTFQTDESLESEMESYISEKVKECVNFSYFEEKTAYTIKEGNVSADVFFGPDNIISKIDYPIEISYQNNEPITEILTFENTKEIRLNKIYTFIYTLLKRESYDLYFDMLNTNYNSLNNPSGNKFNCILNFGFGNSYCYDDNIKVSKIQNVCNNILYPDICDLSTKGLYDDLIVIVDNNSKIYDRPLMFNFLIQNRRPALEKIKPHPGEIDIVVFENETFTLNPQGYDPDNTNINYDYGGWREDYWTEFNKTYWSSHPITDPTYSWYESYNPLYFTIHNDNPNNWTNSYLYLLTHQNASYNTQLGDLGVHKINITVSDEENLKDWQEITVFVRDVPKAIANSSNNYTDIPDKNASVEDIYTLDASYSYVVIHGVDDEFRYKWQEIVDNIDIETEDIIINLPYLMQYGIDYSIDDLENYTFKKEYLNGAPNRPANIDLRVGIILPNGQTSYGESDTLDITVHQCLPHRADTEPYPYAGDLTFQANHTCCGNGTDGTPWGEVKDTTNVCYDFTDYGLLQFFTDDQDTAWVAPYNGSYDPTSIDSITPGVNDNDIYKREFERSCDGYRGNICQGDAEVTTTIHEACSDTLKVGQTGRCYGPPPDLFDPLNSTEDNNVECVTYLFTTFEHLNAGGTNALKCRTDDVCYDLSNYWWNNNWRTATNVSEANGNSPSPVMCNYAYCDGSATENIETGNCARVQSSSQCYCSSSCQTAVSTSLDYSGLSNAGCDGQIPGHTWGNSPGRNDYGCGIDCMDVPCNTQYGFNTNTKACYTNCNNNNNDKCSTDFYCDNTPVSDECVNCNFNFHIQITTGSEGIGLCEEACGASNDCDEDTPNAIDLDGNYCNANCQVQTCEDLFGINYVNNLPGLSITTNTITCNCNDAGSCQAGFICDDDNGQCVQCDGDNTQIGGLLGEGYCELGCNPSVSECDEFGTPGTLRYPMTPSQNGCGLNCEFRDCDSTSQEFNTTTGECYGIPGGTT